MSNNKTDETKLNEACYKYASNKYPTAHKFAETSSVQAVYKACIEDYKQGYIDAFEQRKDYEQLQKAYDQMNSLYSRNVDEYNKIVEQTSAPTEENKALRDRIKELEMDHNLMDKDLDQMRERCVSVLPDLIDLAMDGYKKLSEGSGHEEFLKEDRSTLSKAREFLQSLTTQKP
jgi:septal ring factor EnvC (AmiA/AmiB activator)